jgi:hypothetical protein
VTHAVDVTDTLDQAAASLAEHRRYLEILSPEPVADQVRAVIDMATGPQEGFLAARAVGFELYYFRS